MIWRCGCGHTVSRHDEPTAGTRWFWCKGCHAQTLFTMHPQDQRRARPLPTRDTVGVTEREVREFLRNQAAQEDAW